MTSRTQHLFNLNARYLQKPMLARVANQPLLRCMFAATAFSAKPLRGTRTMRADKNGVEVQVQTPPSAGSALLIYIHGGGFTIGSSFTHRWLGAWLGEAIGAKVWLPDYRMAPETPYPAAPEDCLAVYKAALAEYAPEQIVIAGDSAGGCLTLTTALRARDAGLPQPAALGLLSPATDLDMASPANTEALARDDDMLLPAAWAHRAIPLYLAGHDPKDPGVSPLYADLSDLPPTLLHVGREELLYSHATRLAAKSPQVTVEPWSDVHHVWQLNVGRTREATDSVTRIGAFLKGHLG
ncbi:alpha/beta hydrolase [Pseudaestuariivita sp.]|uniref:alpha/beta hydrolase n=1 Tax=Pseudaestuariivita sp. TaxID=2211669 RepID=UPI0040587479